MADFVKVNLDDYSQCGYSPYLKVFCIKEKQKEYLYAINEQIKVSENAIISDDDRKILLESLKAQKEKLEQALKLSDQYADDHKPESKTRDDAVKTLIGNSDNIIISVNNDRSIYEKNEAIRLAEEEAHSWLDDEDLELEYNNCAEVNNDLNGDSSTHEVKTAGDENILHNYAYHN